MRPILISLTVSFILNLPFSNRAWSSEVIVREQTSNPLGPPRMFRAGAHALDIAPKAYPVLVNGGFLQNQAIKLNDPIRAKAIVLDDDSLRLAIVVVDSCMIPRDLIDRAKELARQKTGIHTDRILISATHTHSAPAAMGALGCPADENYVKILPGLIAESVQRAARNLEPARIGWSSIDDHVHTYCRRFIRRPDKMLDDPFGQRTVRANMHPGYQNSDVIGPSGPVDPELVVLSIQSRSGRPIAVLANYSMHYYGAEPVSADYYGRFAAALGARLTAQAVEPPFVGIMSQGTSGDQMWMDYGGPKKDPGLDAYSAEVARVAHQAHQSITYQEWVPLAMAETTLTLARRTPDAKRLAWATEIVDQMQAQASTKGKPPVPQSQPQVYAKEAIYLHDEPQRELKLQAIRIGGMGITAIPNEVFAITGLKLKLRSPFAITMNIELANGSEGYIPPPEQHRLGGYTTWPARTAGLEIQAEPRIVARVLALLEQVAGKPLRAFPVNHGPYAQSILASKPHAYWRLDDIEELTAIDSTGNGRNASYEGGFALYLPGMPSGGLSAGKMINRAVHLAGGRLRAELVGVGENYSIELWFWNGLPTAIRPITGHLLSFEDATSLPGINIGIGGTNIAPGQLLFSDDDASTKALVGTTEITPKTWHHLALVRDRGQVVIYLDGKTEPEIVGKVTVDPKRKPKSLFVGGIGNGLASFEGKIDEVAIFDRALGAPEIARHFAASRAGETRLPGSRE
jgi:Concanavalin A-like lectin/glucanases superfamily/Neutral/alkaline non-lysosomal ceramidase, N-terminal